jgi:hypothetical protein
VKDFLQACENVPPSETKLATEQLNTNEGGSGVNGKKLNIGKSFEAKKTICSPNLITPIID